MFISQNLIQQKKEMNLNKKGATSWAASFTLVEVMLACIAIGIMFYFVAQMADNSVIHMKYYSRELSMVTLLSQNSPVPLMINFSPSERAFKRFNYTWTKSVLEVKKASGGPGKIYPFFWNQLLWDGSSFVSTPNSLFFINTLGSYSINDKPLALVTGTKCSDVNLQPKTIFLDAGHGEVIDTGLIEGIRKESELTCNIARGVSTSRNLQDVKINSSRPQNEMGTVLCTNTFRYPDDEIILRRKSAELVLEFQIGDNDKAVFKAYVFANSHLAEAQAIACNILREIKRSYPDNVAMILVIPVKEELIDAPIIRLEFGGIRNSTAMEIFDSPAGLYKAIAGVIHE